MAIHEELKMVDSWREMAAEITQGRIRQDRDDLNNEVAGRDTGRIKRFVSAEPIGSEPTNNDDADIQLLSDMILQAEATRQERLQTAYDRSDQIDHAFDLAIAESEQELQEAIRHKQEIFDNGTKLANGRTVFVDEESGEFYDEDNILISELDELDAKLQYKEGDSTRQSWVNSQGKATEAFKKNSSLKQGKEHLIKSRQNLENGDMSLDEFEAELEALEQDQSLKPYLDNENQEISEIRQEASTSVSKNVDGEDGIKSEFALTPAFLHAGSREQVSSKPVHEPDNDKPSPQTSSGMSLG